MNVVQEQYDALTDPQRALFETVMQTAKGRDMRDVLAGQDASAQDMAAVAEVLGGPGSGREFQS